jgi:hypothetical protein
MSAVDVLRANGVNVETAYGANSVDKRDIAIQTLAGYMRRLSGTGVAFRINPRFVVVSKRGSQSTPVLLDGFEAGYVWDTKSTTSTASPNTRRPLKDGYYDHSQNCVEYIVLKFGPSAPTKKQLKPTPEYAPTYIRSDGVGWMA